MKNHQDHASNPLARMRSDSGKPAKSTEEAASARRRALLRAAVSAPVVLGVSPAGAVAAQGSAYRAAMNDATQTPLGIADSADDTWIRRKVPYGTLTVTAALDGEVTSYQGVYQLTSAAGTLYYQPESLTASSFPIELSPDDTLAFVEDTANPKWVLVLFDNTSDDFPEAGVWPEVAANGTNLQGLHCSSWSSLGITDRTYSCSVSAV